MPRGTQVATRANRNRDAINSAVFEDYCETHGRPGEMLKGAVLVLMDQLKMKTSTEAYVDVQSNSVKRWFYENISESDLSKNEDRKGSKSKTAQGRVDSVLKLYYNCPMMLTCNSDVSKGNTSQYELVNQHNCILKEPTNDHLARHHLCYKKGKANGSKARVKRVRLKIGERPIHIQLKSGAFIQAVFASQVKNIQLQHESEDISPSVFDVEATEFSFRCQTKSTYGQAEYAGMKGWQFPIISNTATTGHKLQGSTLKCLLVSELYYRSNWIYVVLSRLRTLDGLYLREKLSEDLTKYEMREEMLDMIKDFEERVSVTWLDESTYAKFEGIGGGSLVDTNPPTTESNGESILFDDFEEDQF